MVADYYTKPSQGTKFRQPRGTTMGAMFAQRWGTTTKSWGRAHYERAHTQGPIIGAVGSVTPLV